MTRSALPQLLDTYWDAHLSRSNLAEPVFGNLGAETGLTKLVGAGRMLATVDSDEDIRRFLLERGRVKDGKPQLVLGRPDQAEGIRPVRVGQTVRASWTWNDAWWGCHVHAVESSAQLLILEFPRIAYRFPVRAQLWSDVVALARMFDGFDFALSDAQDAQLVNHPGRIASLLGAAIDQERPVLLFLSQIGTLFAGRLKLSPGTTIAGAPRSPSTIDLELIGTDMVGLGWRAGVPVTVSVVVNGLTIGFKTKLQGGQDAIMRLAWPDAMFRRQRRRLVRAHIGSRELIDFSLPVKSALGVVSGVARPFRVVDVGPGGVGMVFDPETARDIPDRIRGAQIDLYGKLKFDAHLEVVGRARFGNGHVRLSCAFRGLELKQERALEVVCQKLQEGA